MKKLSQSDGFIAKLPYGKIPDRDDFATLSYRERVKYWKVVIQESERLGDAFIERLSSGRISSDSSTFVRFFRS